MKRLLLSVLAIATAGFAFSQCSDLFFSEYVEGSGNNNGLEIYNPTQNTIDLSGYVVKRYSNGSGAVTESLALSGMLVSGDVVVVINGQTDSVWVDPPGYWSVPIDPAFYAKGDIFDVDYPAPMYFNGDDAITLETTSGGIVDIFGKVGEDPGSAWTDDATAGYTDANGGTWWTKRQTLVRKKTVMDGTIMNPVAFNATLEWDSLPDDTWDSLGFHTCDCIVSVPAVEVSATSMDALCAGACDGTGTASPDVGTLPFTYLWDDANAQTTQTATGLCAGTYTVTGTDGIGGTATATITIGEPTLITGISSGSTETSAGANDGTASVTASGGTGSFTYLWDDPSAQTTPTATGLSPDTYSVTVTDTNGCTFTAMVVVNPFGCTMSSTVTATNESSTGASDGTALVTVTGGVAPYTFLWDDPLAQTDSMAVGLSPGNYEVLVTDANGCGSVSQATIGTLIGLREVAVDTRINIYPNPVSGGTFFLEATSNISFISIFNLAGQVIYENGNPGYRIVKVDLDGTSKGIHFVRVSLDNSVFTTSKISIQ